MRGSSRGGPAAPPAHTARPWRLPGLAGHRTRQKLHRHSCACELCCHRTASCRGSALSAWSLVSSSPDPKQEIGDTRRHKARRVRTDTPGTHEQLLVPAEAAPRARAAAALSAISSPRGAGMNYPIAESREAPSGRGRAASLT